MKKWFPKKNGFQSSIERIEGNNLKANLLEKIRVELDFIEKDINETTRELIKAQLTALKAITSTQQGWLPTLQRRFYTSSINDSVNWHRNRLIDLHAKKRLIKNKLDKLTGDYWPNKIRLWIIRSIVCLGIIFILWILLMVFLTALYLLPIWGSIILIIYFLNKKNMHTFR